ncbi:MAG TPA: hypothetical protein VLA90_10390 [Actinomycetota bacterium]|nr:hypothetical protein [Actinomycetota bacterium]
MKRVLPAALGLLVLAGACSNNDGGGPTGPLSADAAGEAVLGLCEIREATDADAASATFQDRTHQSLHDLAAAAEPIDRGVTADLLTSKQRVEADLEQPALPETFGADVETLLSATWAALETVGLEAPGCPA